MTVVSAGVSTRSRPLVVGEVLRRRRELRVRAAQRAHLRGDRFDVAHAFVVVMGEDGALRRHDLDAFVPFDVDEVDAGFAAPGDIRHASRRDT